MHIGGGYRLYTNNNKRLALRQYVLKDFSGALKLTVCATFGPLAYHRVAFIDLCLRTKFRLNRKNFCVQTCVRKYAHMYVWPATETGFIRLTGRSPPNN